MKGGTNMQQIMLDEKWTFRRGMLDSIGMLEADPGKAVDLPHDGMISLSVSKEAAASVDSGYFPEIPVIIQKT